jgi:serine/threonine-protein kinase
MQPATPTRLGRYEILDELGKGAAGVVYLARDPLIGRLVALKTFRVGYSVKDQELQQFRARFIREAQSAGILSHPNIVTIHDVVEEGEDGVAFIAMEYVRGTNLKQLLQGGTPLELPFAAEIVRQVGEALDYAHSKGVVHRDIKPANIIITADNRVKITDFGIARIDASNLTQEGQLLGTPNYMAPEQILGREVDHRADLFSLGVVLYEMLTRHKPFQGENLTVVSHRIVYDQFTPPRQYARDLPPAVERILDKALAKDPEQRYERARDLYEQLRRVAGDLPPSAAESLNDTQSLGETAVVMDAPAAPPVAARPAARPAARRASARRVALIATAAAAVPVFLIAAALLALAWTQPPPSTAAARDLHPQVVPLITRGAALLRSGRAPQAAAAFGSAERLAPELPVLGRLRRDAEQRWQHVARRAAVEQEIAAQTAQARALLDLRAWDDAQAAARRVLALDPNHAEAQQLVAQAADGRRRQAEARRPVQRASTGATRQPPPVSGPTKQPSSAQPAAAAEATLVVELHSDLPSGTLMLYSGNRRLLQRRFEFGERGGFLRSRKPAPGWFRQSLPLAAGNAALRLYVTPDGRKAEVQELSGNFPGGAERRLAVHLHADGQMTANLY